KGVPAPSLGEQPVQSPGRFDRRHIAVAAQIQKMPIGVQQSVVTVDQNAERNTVEESRGKTLLRHRPDSIKLLFARRVMRRFARGLARFSVLLFALFLALFFALFLAFA